MKQMQVRSFKQYFKHIISNNMHDANGFNVVKARSKQPITRRQPDQSLHNSALGIYRLYEENCYNTITVYYFTVSQIIIP
jgi:hypothetical protein